MHSIYKNDYFIGELLSNLNNRINQAIIENLFFYQLILILYRTFYRYCRATSKKSILYDNEDVCTRAIEVIGCLFDSSNVAVIDVIRQ